MVKDLTSTLLDNPFFIILIGSSGLRILDVIMVHLVLNETQAYLI